MIKSGRSPACSAPEPLAGSQCITSGYRKKQANLSSGTSSLQGKKALNCGILSIGNRCDHNKYALKTSPIFAQNAAKIRLPLSILQAGERFNYLSNHLMSGIPRDNILHDKNRKSGVMAWFVSIFESQKFLELLYHDKKETIRRKRRSEGVESIVLLALATLISGVNLQKMAYGFYNNRNEFIYLNYSKLSQKSGLSISRLKRAMKVLKHCGLVDIKNQLLTLPSGKIITLETQIHVSDEVFHLLGLHEQYLIDREYHSKKYQERGLKLERKQNKLAMYAKQLSNQQRPNIKNLTEKLTKIKAPASAGNGLKIRDRLSDLVRSGMSVSDAMKIVKSELPPPH